MRDWKKVLSAGIFLVMAMAFATSAEAQDEDVEVALAKQEAERSMRVAEMQLEEAARRIAELSSEQLARFGEFEQRIVIAGQSRGPVIGITIGADSNNDPVEGVAVVGISPGGAADESGIRTGDIITALNGESMSSANGQAANRKLTDFMSGVEEGDVLDVDYLRNGKTYSAELSPQQRSARVFGFRFDDSGMRAPPAPSAPHVASFSWMGQFGGHGFGEMEMVELNASLGRYFGTDSGLLIVKAPKDNSFQLEDGDVLKSIDGRTPENLRHAVRILGSYESGETVKLKILRDKREKTITVEIPDNKRSRLGPVPAADPAAAVVLN